MTEWLSDKFEQIVNSYAPGDAIWQHRTYCHISNTNSTLVGNTNVDHPDVVGASPDGAAPTADSFSTWHLASMD